jgi:predicted  nucleic acid-binding Zn-ribbon protein
MSHFYLRKSYTFAETDEQMPDIRKEMSNFITKEEAEDLLNRRKVIVDPNPNFYHSRFEEMSQEIFNLKQEIYFLRTTINKIHSKIELDEPTL